MCFSGGDARDSDLQLRFIKTLVKCPTTGILGLLKIIWEINRKAIPFRDEGECFNMLR